MSTLDDLAAASAKLREADQRRKDQQAYVDDLIARAKAEGAGWTDLINATGYAKRSLQLALARIEKRQ